ncbi:hypothetical protein PoB_000291300 [Plakobranchus ocellatus]|uniref:Uncharacterized protein n=1 Tax=Plakobranchus ocellatus TaxID=259542 RepID=A0AAV3Y221_9GAST|nr:hypothetical protein PoB_000291300 [Plakobranchus ocellatus]
MSDIKTKRLRSADEFSLSGRKSSARGLGKVKDQSQLQVTGQSLCSAEDSFDDEPTVSGKNEVNMQSMFVTNQKLIGALRDRVEKLKRRKKRARSSSSSLSSTVSTSSEATKNTKNKTS